MKNKGFDNRAVGGAERRSARYKMIEIKIPTLVKHILCVIGIPIFIVALFLYMTFVEMPKVVGEFFKDIVGDSIKEKVTGKKPIDEFINEQ